MFVHRIALCGNNTSEGRINEARGGTHLNRKSPA